jgi:hypothetical protein
MKNARRLRTQQKRPETEVWTVMLLVGWWGQAVAATWWQTEARSAKSWANLACQSRA